MTKLLNNKQCDTTNYAGTVTIKVYEKDTLLSTITDHNTGMSKLFSFINSCLVGDFQAAKKSRPCKIVLLKSLLDKNTEKEQFIEAADISAPILYDKTVQSTVETDDNGNPNGSTTYHFRIPSLNLYTGGEDKKIKKLLLLPAMYTSFEKDACAKFILAEEIPLPERSNNLTIIVDWTLKFTNKD